MNVTYVSACLDSSGYAAAARNHIAALYDVGVTINVKSVSFEGYRSDLGRLGVLVQSLMGRNSEGDIRILHLTPQNYEKLIKPGKYNIGYCAWETDMLPKHWNKMIKRLDEVWVPSEHNKEVFERCGITIPVCVMPHPFETDIEQQDTTDSLVANVDSNDFVFYSIFQWTERKNPLGLLKAYLTEFKRDEKVALVIKTYLMNPNNSQEGENIKKSIQEIKRKLWLPSYPKVLLISSLLSSAQINALHTEGDCYLSLHRCEGFGIPLADAMLAGNPVITTGYGGQIDFMESQSLVDFIMTPVYGMPWDLYTGEMNWAQPDILHARRRMRGLFENQEFAKKQGELGRQEVQEKLNYNVLGNRMKARLEKIQETL